MNENKIRKITNLLLNIYNKFVIIQKEKDVRYYIL